MIDWEKPLEWSDGEQAFLADQWQGGNLSKNVTACQLWEKHTGEAFVMVCSETGRVLGMEDEYPHIRNAKPPASNQDCA